MNLKKDPREEDRPPKDAADTVPPSKDEELDTWYDDFNNADDEDFK